MTSLVQKHGRQCMPCSTKFSVTLQTEILSIETSDFLTQIIFLKSFNSEDYYVYVMTANDRSYIMVFHHFVYA